MTSTLRQAKAEARAYRNQGDHARALALYERILSSVPLANEVRLLVADTLAEIGANEAAAQVYKTVAIHDIRSGHPLPAVVASHALVKMGFPVDEIEELLVRTFASGSPQLARFAIKPAPVNPETKLETGDLSKIPPLPQVAENAGRAAIDLSVFVGYQEQYHPLPFLSELSRESFFAVGRSVRILRLADGQTVMRQGDKGDSLFLVANGELRVFVTGSDGVQREVARVFENTLFGEMALITGQPRTASVAAVGEADVIEISRAALEHVMKQVPAVRDSLDRFSRERLIKNLLQSSPIFAPFTKSQQGELLRRFEGHEVEAGTELIVEGERGKGLFLILSGECDVVAHSQTSEPVQLARLRAGEMFGEMSLVTDQPTSASVRAATPASVLFLAREYVERLAEAIPEIQTYFEQLAMTRARDNTLRFDRGAIPEEAIEVDLSDVIPV